MAERHLDLSAEGVWPPSWPMGLTYLRLLLLPVFLYLLLDSRDVEDAVWARRWALAVFAVMAITDKLDGVLARRLGKVSRVGALLDPVADKLLLSISVVLLSFRWCAPGGFALPWWVVAAVYGRDLVVVMGILVLLGKIQRVSIRPRWAGKVACALQMLMVLATLAATDAASLLGNPAAWWLCRGLWALTAGVSVASMADYFVLGLRLYNEPAIACSVPAENPAGVGGQPGQPKEPQ